MIPTLPRKCCKEEGQSYAESKARSAHHVIQHNNSAGTKGLVALMMGRCSLDKKSILASDLGRDIVKGFNVGRAHLTVQSRYLGEPAFGLGKMSKEVSLGRIDAYRFDLALLFRCQCLRRILGETTLDHLFHSQCLDSQQVEDHVVSQAELRD